MSTTKIVNVASVPKRSPFRYPGGKTWLIPMIRQWIKSLPCPPSLFLEPFVGGGIVSLTVAFERLAENVVMVELDEDVASVWQTILGGEALWLAERIGSFELTVETAKEELASSSSATADRAFRTILKNRIFHGGILAPGSSMIRNGENGKGIKSRWYASTLQQRIKEIDAIRNKIKFIEGDGLAVIEREARRTDAAVFIDPPYTAAGKKAGSRLYRHNELDHERLFDLAAALKGDFLMTYDNADGVKEMAARRGFDTEAIAMKNTHHAEMTELLIGKDLSWARRTLPKRKQALLFEDV